MRTTRLLTMAGGRCVQGVHVQGGCVQGGVSGGYAGGCVQGVVHNPLDPEADTPLPREQNDRHV